MRHDPGRGPRKTKKIYEYRRADRTDHRDTSHANGTTCGPELPLLPHPRSDIHLFPAVDGRQLSTISLFDPIQIFRFRFSD